METLANRFLLLDRYVLCLGPPQCPHLSQGYKETVVVGGDQPHEFSSPDFSEWGVGNHAEPLAILLFDGGFEEQMLPTCVSMRQCRCFWVVYQTLL